MKLPLLLSLIAASALAAAPPAELSVAAYPSIQKAIDANPGRMIYVPAGDYEINERLRLRSDNSGLYGFGRIIQTNPAEPIISIVGAAGVRLRDLTLTRPEGKMDTRAEGVVATKCRDLRIDDVRVQDNHILSETGAIALYDCHESQIRGCLIENYCSISVDDRTANKVHGFAFRAIFGNGIAVKNSKATLIEGCRVIERRLGSTPELQQKFKLGEFVKKNPVKGTGYSQEFWDSPLVKMFNQQRSIWIQTPMGTDFVQILGNYIENSGQGIDNYGDHVLISGNIINNTQSGMKSVHGSRNVIITGNQFIRNDLWAISMSSGGSGHPALEGKPETDNSDGGSIIANNIVSDFVRGDFRWILSMETDAATPKREVTMPSVFAFVSAPSKEDYPPAILTDLIIQGNVIYNLEAPLYGYAVRIADGPNGPKGLHFSGNIFPPGTEGIANTKLPE